MIPLLLSAALLAPADTDPVVPAPTGAAPRIEVGQIKDGKYVSTVNVIQAVPVTKEIQVTVNGRVEKRTITEYTYQTRAVQVTRDLSKATVTDATGKKLDAKALARRLEKPAAVVWSADGKAVDKGYLALFKPNTIVIVGPLPAAPGVIPVPPPVKPQVGKGD